MLLFLFSFSVSFILFYFSLPLNPFFLWSSEMRLLSLWFWRGVSFSPISKSIKTTLLTLNFSFFTARMSPRKNNFIPTVEINSEMSLLHLPDLVLECILEKLPPEGLCRMASVCKSLRDRCMSDHLWEEHMKRKWGRIVGPTAYKEWQCYIASRNGSILYNQAKKKAFVWPFALIGSSFSSSSSSKKKGFTPLDSIMSWYLALDSGSFWFPAQVYNRENGHVGFMLSCYDAMLSYDRRTNTFRARYPPHGARASSIESGVTWDRVRASPVDTSPLDLHISDCLYDLQPGDQMEIQWRRNKEFPYGWWYGVVGHLETCDGSSTYCLCHHSETVVLEFHQYARGSRWRRTIVNRKNHREEGNEANGFYGGIRKLYGDEEISMWKKMWPAQVLE